MLERYVLFRKSFHIKKDSHFLEPCVIFLNRLIKKLAGKYNEQKLKTIYDFQGLIFVENIDESHWIVHHVNMEHADLLQYNSTANPETETTVFQLYIEKVLLCLRQKEMPTVSPKWTASVAQRIPKQTNGYDCGVFALLYVECIIKKVPFNFEPAKMKHIRKKMLFLFLNQTTMLSPSIEEWCSGLEKATEIKNRFIGLRTKNKSPKKPAAEEPKLTKAEINREADEWMVLYKANDQKIERIRNEEVQKRVKELLCISKKDCEKVKKEEVVFQKNNEENLNNNKKEIATLALKAVKQHILCTKVQRKEARAKLNQFYPPHNHPILLDIIDSNINMCKYFPGTHDTVSYFKTATFDNKTGKPIDVVSLVNPRWMYYHFNRAFLELVKLKPKQWMSLPVGFNSNAMEPPLLFSKINIKYQQVKTNKTCLYDSLSSAISYVHKHKKGDTIFSKIANEINQLGKGNENQPYEFQIKNVISKIKEYNTSFAQVQHLVGNRKKRKKHITTLYDPLCKYTNTTNSMTILVPIGHDDVASHAVTIIDRLVFDSVLPHPLILSKESLDWCCNCEGGMKGIKHAVKITLSKQVQNKDITYEELKYKLK